MDYITLEFIALIWGLILIGVLILCAYIARRAGFMLMEQQALKERVDYLEFWIEHWPAVRPEMPRPSEFYNSGKEAGHGGGTEQVAER